MTSTAVWRTWGAPTRLSCTWPLLPPTTYEPPSTGNQEVRNFIFGGQFPRCGICGWYAPSGAAPILARHSDTHPRRGQNG